MDRNTETEDAQWERVLTTWAEGDTLALTLEDALVLIQRVCLIEATLEYNGPTLIQMKSGASSASYALAAAVSFWVRRLMGAHSALQFWSGTNGFARTLPLRRILTSYTLGQMLVMEMLTALHALEVLTDLRLALKDSPEGYQGPQ